MAERKTIAEQGKMPSVCHIEITSIDSMPRVWREAESARSKGMDVTIIGQGKDCVRHGIRFIGFPEAGSRIKRVFSRSRKMIKAAVDTGADIIQIHSPEFMLYVPYLKRRGKKIIFDSHEFYGLQIEMKTYIPRALRVPTARIYKAVEKAVCRHIDCVLYPCTLEGKNYFENRAARSVKIENFSSPISVPEKIRTSEKYVIYAGALTHDRGITALAEAIRLTDCRLILCGTFFSEAYKEKILSASDRIEYKGVLSREELFAQYARASAGIATLLPLGQYTRIDNMSTKVYEYMQCGIPTVLSNFPFWKDQNDRYRFGITVDPEDPEEIAGAIRFLADNPDAARTMGENGQKAVREAFNWEKEAAKLLPLYFELAR